MRSLAHPAMLENVAYAGQIDYKTKSPSNLPGLWHSPLRLGDGWGRGHLRNVQDLTNRQFRIDRDVVNLCDGIRINIAEEAGNAV